MGQNVVAKALFRINLVKAKKIIINKPVKVWKLMNGESTNWLVLSSQANKDKYMLRINRRRRWWKRGEKTKEKMKYSLLFSQVLF